MMNRPVVGWGLAVAAVVAALSARDSRAGT